MHETDGIPHTQRQPSVQDNKTMCLHAATQEDKTICSVQILQSRGKKQECPETSFMICLSGECCRGLHNPQQAVEPRFDLCTKALKKTTFTKLVIPEWIKEATFM